MSIGTCTATWVCRIDGPAGPTWLGVCCLGADKKDDEHQSLFSSDNIFCNINAHFLLFIFFFLKKSRFCNYPVITVSTILSPIALLAELVES